MGSKTHGIPLVEQLEPRLLMSRTLFAELFASCQLIDVPATGGLSISDELSEQIGANMYRFTAPAKGKLEMLMSDGGSGLDSFLRVFNARGRQVRRNDNASRDTTDSRVRMGIKPGRTYYVAASSRAGAGGYELDFTSTPKDEFGNSFGGARWLRIASNGAGRAAGQINYAGDVDMLQFVATTTGRMEMSLSPGGRNNELEGRISAYGADGQLLSTDEGGVLAVDVVEGQKYYLAITGANDTVGRYRLRINPTIPGFLVDAETLGVPAAGTAGASGSLAAGGMDSYRVTAPARGELRITMAPGGGLSPHVLVYNDKGRLVARDVAAGGEAACNLYCGAGSVYYVVAAAADGTSGAYALSVSSVPDDDYANTIDSSGALSLNGGGSGSISGRIDYAGDVDVLSVAAAANGTMTVSMTPASAELNGIVTVYDAAGDLVDSGAGSVTFEVLNGQVYYLQASGADGGEGRYRLDVSTEADAVLPPAPPELDPLPGQTIAAETYSTSGGLQLLVIGTDGADSVTVNQTGSSVTVATGSGVITCDGVYTSIVVYGFGGNDVIRLTSTVSAASWLYGGAGDDAVYEAGAGAGALYGGLGDDLLVAVGGGTDALYGGDGLDGFWGDTGDGIGDADAAETAARSIHKIQRFHQPWTNNASSGDYVSLEIAGQELRDPVITSAAAGYNNFADRYPLFVDGAQYDDIVQGSIGDCYYLASLASVADTDPGFIEQMIAPLGDGTFAVRFYRDGQEVYLRIDGDLPVRGSGSPAYARLGADGELWVPLMEKAYAFFRYEQNSYASINGGWMSTVYEEMTNMSTGFMWAYQSSDSVWRFMERTLAGGHAVTAGSYYNASSPIVGSHAYMIKSLEQTDEGRFVTVYNPWGVDGRSYDANYYDGMLRLSMAQFQNSFQALATCSA